MKLVSLVFSFRNESDNILEMVTRVENLFAILPDYHCELIYVNDLSTDDSLSLLRSLRDAGKPIKILNMSRRFGVTPCVLEGMKFAKGDAIVYLDSDLQDPPELISEMLKCYEAGFDVVHTKRTKRLGEPKFKIWITNIAYKIINVFSDIDLPQNVGDYKLLSRRAVEHILGLKEYDPYMRGLAIWVGFKQTTIEYVRDPRLHGDTSFPLIGKGPVNEFIRGITSFSAGPLYISFICSVVLFVFAILLALYAVAAKYVGIAAPGSSGIILIMSLMFSFLFMTNGIMGIYIAKIYYQVKGRPRAIVESVE